MSDDDSRNQSEFMLDDPEASRVSTSYGADFEKKISEARAKRAEVLSARKASAGKVEKKVMFGSTRHNKLRLGTPQQPVAPEMPGVNLSGANAVGAVLVFAGSAGFGLGVVLGFGVLLGVGLPSVKGEEQIAVVQTPPIEPQPEVLQLELDAQKSDAAFLDESTSETEFDAIPTSYDILDVSLSEPKGLTEKDLTPVLEPIAAVSLPSFSNVSYMRGDIAQDDAVELRTIPIVDAPVIQATRKPPETPKPAQFFMHAPDGLSDRQLQRYISNVEGSGAEVVEVGRESFRVSTTHLRYYSPHTAEAAMEVAREMGVEARDFSENVHKNARVEVWVAGRPKSDESDKQTSRGFFSWLNEERRDTR